MFNKWRNKILSSILLKSKAALYFLFFTCVCFFYSFSQEPVHYNFTLKNGLPSSEVYHVYQDKKGYIWICTDAGLVKYNGNKFKVFDSSNGLPDNTIFETKEDRYRRLWFRSYSGKIGFIRNDSVFTIGARQKITSFQKSGVISSFALDENDNLILGKQNADKISFLKISPPYNEENVSEIWKNGKTSYGTDVRILANQEMVYSETLEQRDFRKKTYNYILGIFDPSGNRIQLDTSIYIFGTAPYTKFIYAGKKLLFVKELKLRTYDLSKQTAELKNLNFTPICISVNKKGEVLVGGKGGADLLDVSVNNKVFLSNYTVSSILEDWSGNYWIATLEHGLFYIPDINFNTYDLSEENKSSVHLLKNIGGNRFLVSFQNSDTKLIEINNKEISVTGRIKLKSEFGVGPVLSVSKLSQDKLLLSHYNGSCIYDLKKAATIPVFKFGNVVGVFKNIIPYKDKLMVTNYRDIFISDLKDFKILDTIPCFDRINSVTYNYKLDKCFIGCLHGLYEYHGQSSIQKSDLILSLRVEALKSSNDHIFIATKENGLIVYDGQRFDTITKEHGLLSNICKTLEVAGDQVWIATNGGLSKINYKGYKNYSLENYPLSDILPSSAINNLTVFGNRLLFSVDGNIYSFPFKKHLFVEKFYINSLAVNDKVMNLRKPLILSHFENNIKIHFEGLFYSNIGRNEYRYRLISFTDSTWKYTNETNIYLPSLSPGPYSIQLQAKTSSGKWKSADRILHFYIKKPFWLRWGFLVVVFLFCIAVVIFIYILRYRYVLKREKEKNRIQTRMYELETKAAKAQMNPHFIFNSLNSIQQFILERDNEKAFFYLTRFSKLIRRLLESNRSETITLEEEMDLLKKYLEIESMRFDKAFNYKIINADGLIPSNIKIPHMMVQPFVENAIWHGLLHKNGERNLEVSFNAVNNEVLRCVIEDDGVGRKPETENKKGRKSLGIEFIKERLEIMSNNYNKDFFMTVIDKKDLAGKPLGTRVEITLPIINQ